MNLKALWFLAVSALGLGYLPAMAADLIIDTPAVDPEPDTSVVDWTGFYVGLGLSKGRIESGLDTLELVLDGQEQDYGVFDNSVGVALLAGYNVQLDQLVLGGELEVDLLGPASLGTYDIDTGDFENAFATCSYGADPACAEFSVLGALDMKGRLRVTAGMEVTPGLMVFLSGGLSVADASVAGYKVFAANANSSSGGYALSSPVTERLIGGNIGVGGQVALNQNISLRGEVIYDAFGEVPYYMNTGSSVTGSSVSAATDSVSFSQLSARASLIWKF